MFTDPRTTGGVVIEWYGGVPPDDPRFGWAIPPYPVQPLLDVTAMAFGGAVVDAPAATAERLARLFATEVTFLDPAARPGAPQAGVSLGDMTLTLYAIEAPDVSRALWGHVYERAQTSSLGVLVPDLGSARRALTDARVPMVRDDGDVIVVDPVATGGIVLAIVGQLPAGDPRRGAA